MLFYRLWMSRRKTGSDTAHQWKRGYWEHLLLGHTQDCCCHSGLLVLETQIHLGGLFDHVWAKKARTFSWEWRVCYMRWYAAYTWWFIFIGSKASRMITQTLELTHKGFSPQLVSHKDDPSFQQQRGKNTYHLSYTQAVEQTFQVHMLQSGVHGPS